MCLLTRIKVKESEKFDEFIDFVGGLKKLWNMKEIVISIIVGAFEIITKNLEKKLSELEIRGRIKTIQTTELPNQPGYLEESWTPEEICCLSDSSEKHQLELAGKIRIKQNNQKPRPCQRPEKVEEHEGGDDISCSRNPLNNPHDQRLSKVKTRARIDAN